MEECYCCYSHSSISLLLLLIRHVRSLNAELLFVSFCRVHVVLFAYVCQNCKFGLTFKQKRVTSILSLTFFIFNRLITVHKLIYYRAWRIDFVLLSFERFRHVCWQWVEFRKCRAFPAHSRRFKLKRKFLLKTRRCRLHSQLALISAERECNKRHTQCSKYFLFRKTKSTPCKSISKA